MSLEAIEYRLYIAIQRKFLDEEDEDIRLGMESQGYRDEFMAKTANIFLDSDNHVIIWAHNEHISKKTSSYRRYFSPQAELKFTSNDLKAMGSYIKDTYLEQYHPIAFFAYDVKSRQGEQSKQYKFSPPTDSNFIEKILHDNYGKDMILNLSSDNTALSADREYLWGASTKISLQNGESIDWSVVNSRVFCS